MPPPSLRPLRRKRSAHGAVSETSAASSGSGRTTSPGDNAQIESLLGRVVLKEFKPYGLFSGVLAKVVRSLRAGLVVYEDGDAEELELAELQAILAPRDTAVSQDLYNAVVAAVGAAGVPPQLVAPGAAIPMQRADSIVESYEQLMPDEAAIAAAVSPQPHHSVGAPGPNPAVVGQPHSVGAPEPAPSPAPATAGRSQRELPSMGGEASSLDDTPVVVRTRRRRRGQQHSRGVGMGAVR